MAGTSWLPIGVPIVLLGAAEIGLRLAGWGYPTSFCLLHRKDHVYTDNDKFLWQFYSRKTNLRPVPFSVETKKPAGAARIVILGESAAAGTPEPAFSFGRILERMLRQRYPQRKIEVINAAMRGVNSHILLPTARDCLRLSPDLFIVYMGNNEAVGLHAPGPRSGRLTGHRSLLRCVQRTRSTRLGEWASPALDRLNRESAPTQSQDAAFFQEHRVATDDPRRGAVYDNFRANLADICRLAHESARRRGADDRGRQSQDLSALWLVAPRKLSESDKRQWDTNYNQGVQLENAETSFRPLIAMRPPR